MFEIIKSERGVAKLADGTIAYLRLVITGILELGRQPTGLNLSIGNQVLITVESPEEVKKLVAGKPRPKDTKYSQEFDRWEIIDVIDKKLASEDVRYKGSDGHTYKIHFEIEPVLASRNVDYQDQFGNPNYFVRWGDRLIVEMEKS